MSQDLSFVALKLLKLSDVRVYEKKNRKRFKNNNYEKIL